MNEDDENSKLTTPECTALWHWIKVANQRKGFGGTFAKKTNQDKQIIEACVMEEWVKAMHGAFGTIVTEVRQNPFDPPDFWARIGSDDVGVELMELLTQKHVERVMGKRNENPQHGQLFKDAQWNRNRFKAQISAAITAKATSYKKRKIHIDVLVLYTGEPWLMPNMARDWLQETTFDAPDNVRAAFLLFEYWPGYAHHWPVFRLFDQTGNRPH